ncbi:MAG: terminase small subunit [Prevotella sp.]|nr:terminase small subunit [Prevotella sp.]
MSAVLTRNQKRFLYGYMKTGSIEESAALCGIPPDRAYEEGIKILDHPQAMEFVTNLSLTEKRFAEKSSDKIEESLNRLIGGRINDAVILARADPETLTEADIRGLDLYNVSELKFGKGVCEIKFADRLKAIEKLNEIRNVRASDGEARSFFDAIAGAADTRDGEREFSE